MQAQPAASADTVTVTASKPSHPSHFWAGNSFSFHDILDAINPLQHLPVIGTIYRHLTGDNIGNVAEVVGDGIYGGLMGLASGLVDVAVKEVTGKDIGENLISMVTGDDKPKAPAEISAPAANPASPDPSPSQPPVPAIAATDVKVAATSVSGPAPQAPDEAAAPTKAAPARTAMSLPVGRGFIPIDTSDRGITRLRALAATHNPEPVPLDLPPGTRLTNSPTPAATPVDFVAKMRDGLDKYQALMAAQSKPSTPQLNQLR